MVWLVWYGLVWGGRGQMTIEFIHEEILIMDYQRGGGVMTSMDDRHG